MSLNWPRKPEAFLSSGVTWYWISQRGFPAASDFASPVSSSWAWFHSRMLPRSSVSTMPSSAFSTRLRNRCSLSCSASRVLDGKFEVPPVAAPSIGGPCLLLELAHLAAGDDLPVILPELLGDLRGPELRIRFPPPVFQTYPEAVLIAFAEVDMAALIVLHPEGGKQDSASASPHANRPGGLEKACLQKIGKPVDATFRPNLFIANRPYPTPHPVFPVKIGCRHS